MLKVISKLTYQDLLDLVEGRCLALKIKRFLPERVSIWFVVI